MKILLLGSNGMLGHMIKQYLSEKEYEVFCTTRDKNDKYYYDVVANVNHIEEIIKDVKPSVVINCIGILNKQAEEDKSRAVLVNGYLPHYIDKLSELYKFKFIHISTDCVFDGANGEYIEGSFKDAKNFYGQSKAIGEVINNRNVTLRTSIIGPDINEKGIGLFKWFMEQTEPISGYSKVVWTGVTTLQLAKCIEMIIKNDVFGLFHVVNNKKIDKYELLQLFKKYFRADMIINKAEDYISDKSLINTNTSFDFCVSDYEDMIIEMKNWILSHEVLYEKLIKQIK